MEGTASFQMFDMISNSDGLSKCLYVILTFYSLITWAIIFDKIFKFRLLKLKTEKFDKLFWSGKMLEDIYRQVKNNATYPSAMIFCAAMQEWESSNVLNIVKSNDSHKKESLKERLASVMETALVKSMGKLQYGMTFWVLVLSTSTLFGLFGTVWGFIHTFASIAKFQDSSLVVMAPGISGDFMTTVFGLICAIPATAAYTIYKAKIDDFEDKMISFSSEVLVILSRELD